MAVIVGRTKMSDYHKWIMPGCSHIDSLENAARWASRSRANGVPVLLTSGGFDPIHPGHISYLRDSVDKVREYHQQAYNSWPSHLTFIVAVNGDEFLVRKKGKAFMPLKARCQVASSVIGDITQNTIIVPFVASDPHDTTVCEAIEVLRPTYFCKGGDRTLDNIPEVEVCARTRTIILTGCGEDKYWSSSNFLRDYEKHVLKKNKCAREHVGQFITHTFGNTKTFKCANCNQGVTRFDGETLRDWHANCEVFKKEHKCD